MAEPSDGKCERPMWVNFVIGLLQLWLYIYDAITYVPIMLFVQPRQRVARGERTKALRSTSAPIWHNVGESSRDSIVNEIYRGGAVTIDELWTRAVKTYGEKKCMGTRHIRGVSYEVQKDGRKFDKVDLDDEYSWQSYNQVNQRVQSIARSLAHVKLPAGGRICIYAETRADWMQMALACLQHKLTIVTVYATLGEEAIQHAINETESSTIVCSADLLQNVAAITANCGSLERVIYFPLANPETPTVDVHSLFDGPVVYSLSEFIELGHVDNYEAGDARYNLRSRSQSSEDDLAMIMYTSGTTGPPKGVMITNENIIAATSSQTAGIPELGQRDDDIFCAFLPLAHILEVDCEIACLMNGAQIGYSSALTMTDRSSKIAKGGKGDCTVLKPTMLAAVPAIMDRIYKNISSELSSSHPVMSGIIELCIQRRTQRLETGFDDPFLNRFVFSRIRRILGGHVRCMLSGGAPLNRSTQRFITVCFCCPVLQGYGLTETCGATTLSDADDLQTGHVGPPLLCNSIRLREWSEGGYSPDDSPASGEVLISGKNLSPGYWRNPSKTKDDFVIIDGVRYFATGDIGEMKSDGSMLIVDRKKDLVKLCHGEYVSLAKVETALITNKFVDNMCIYADSHQMSCVALVVPNEVAVNKLATELGFDETDWDKLCESKELNKAIYKSLVEHGKKGKLSKIDMPAAVHLCPTPWTPTGGLLTEALKLKRRPIAQAYKSALEKMYGTTINVK